MEVLDTDLLLTICDGDHSEVRGLLRLVIDSARLLIDKLGAAFDRSDLADAKNLAHELRGAAATAGALELAALAGRLDDELRSAPGTGSASAYLSPMKGALDRLVAAADGF